MNVCSKCGKKLRKNDKVCPNCGKKIEKQSIDQIVDNIMALEDGTRIQILAPVVRSRKGEFIKIAFCKDQTYCIGYNFWNMEFAVKTNIMLKQYPKTVNNKLAAWIFDWVNRLNR